MSMLIGLIFDALVGEAVRRDYERLAAQGIRVGRASARKWAYGVFFLLILVLPYYFFRRGQALRRHLAEGKAGKPPRD